MRERVPFRPIAIVAITGAVSLACLAVGVAGAHPGPEADRPVADAGPPVLQAADDATPLVAAVGILALAVLGGTLVARNRLRGRADAPPAADRVDGEAFVTDRERVRRLVKQNGGRMKQAEIVDSVEWSKAKVSRLLADLESDDEITKLRLGRENLICLAGYEPTASQPSDPEGE